MIGIPCMNNKQCVLIDRVMRFISLILDLEYYWRKSKQLTGNLVNTTSNSGQLNTIEPGSNNI